MTGRSRQLQEDAVREWDEGGGPERSLTDRDAAQRRRRHYRGRTKHGRRRAFRGLTGVRGGGA